jgi:hypothetical protein
MSPLVLVQWGRAAHISDPLPLKADQATQSRWTWATQRRDTDMPEVDENRQ